MDAQLKAKWIAALRSGEFKQTTNGEIFNGDAYCCLGVLSVLRGHLLTPDKGDHEDLNNRAYFDCTSVLGVGLKHACITLNDKGTPFAQIADWLESQP